MDGGLIDSHPVHRKAWRKFLATVGKNIDDHQLQYILEGRRRENILRYFLGELPDATLVQYGRQKGQFFQANFKDVPLAGFTTYAGETLLSKWLTMISSKLNGH